jgi:TPR repeat protein
LSIPDKNDGTRYIRQSAEAGYTEAMRELASRFQTGSGTAQDLEAAKQWYKKAADAGDPVAAAKLRDLTAVVQAANVRPASAPVKPLEIPAKQQNTAKKQESPEQQKVRVQAPAKEKERPVMVATVTKPPVSEKRAAAPDKSAGLSKVAEYEKAAEAGDPQAKVALADMTKNTHKAYALYLEAANAGYLPAMRRLAECHIHGRGTSVSEIDGINWYRKAAWAGDAESAAILKQKGKTLY